MKQSENYNQIDTSPTKAPVTLVSRWTRIFPGLSPKAVLAEVQESLSSHSFGDNKWTADYVDEEKGCLSLTCLIKGKPNRVTPALDGQLVTLNVHTDQIYRRATMELTFHVDGDSMALCAQVNVLCCQTVDYLVQRVKLLTQQ